MQQSQQRVSGAVVNQYGGSSSSTVQTNGNLFGTCMNARGWYLQRPGQTATSTGGAPAAPNPIQQRSEERQAEVKAVCADPQFQELLAKSPCNIKDVTLAQLADTSKLAENLKPAFDRYKQLGKQRVAKDQEVFRKYGGDRGTKLAALGDEVIAINDKNSLALYTGRITWGQYNEQRQADARQTDQEWSRIAQGR